MMKAPRLSQGEPNGNGVRRYVVRCSDGFDCRPEPELPPVGAFPAVMASPEP